eukprot:scaffold9726_cov119-Isochrysis_galbana.AAC.6
MPCVTYALASTAASSSSYPLARSAAVADDRLHPVPWYPMLFPPCTRSQVSQTGGLVPSQSTSCTSSSDGPCPPLRSTAAQRVRRCSSSAAASASVVLRMRRPSSASASGMLGVRSRQRGKISSRMRETPSASISCVPVEESITGSHTMAPHPEAARAAATSRTTSAEPSMPSLIASARMSSPSARSDSRTLCRLGSSMCCTPTEF